MHIARVLLALDIFCFLVYLKEGDKETRQLYSPVFKPAFAGIYCKAPRPSARLMFFYFAHKCKNFELI